MGGKHDTAPIDFVRKIVIGMTRHFPSHVDRDELIGEGLLHLVEAKNRLDSSRSVTSDDYVGARVRGAVVDSLRRLDPTVRSRKRRTQHDIDHRPLFIVFDADEVRLAVDQQHKSAVDRMQQNEDETLSIKQLYQALDTLPQREYEVIVRRFFNGEDLEEIGKELGVSSSRVSQLSFRALRQLRRVLGNTKPMDRNQSLRFIKNSRGQRL